MFLNETNYFYLLSPQVFLVLVKWNLEGKMKGLNMHIY